jgi:hypothetical protein
MSDYASDGGRGWEYTEGSVVPLEGEEEEDFFQIFRTGELIFTARVESVQMQDASFTQLPAPVTRVLFKDIKMVKGEMPKESAFRYPRPPETLKLPRGATVIVVLNRPEPQSKRLEITSISVATKTKLDLARTASEIASGPAS